MPRGDGRGPMGYGPKTGRGLGYCAGYNQPGYMNNGFGGGRGFGRGYGRGYGIYGGYRGYGGYYSLNNEEEKNVLNNQIRLLEEELKNAKNRLFQIKGQKKEK